MSREQDFDKLRQQIRQDPALLKRLTSLSDETELARELTALARSRGISVTEQEVQQALKPSPAPSGKLSDADLDAVAGGGGSYCWNTKTLCWNTGSMC